MPHTRLFVLLHRRCCHTAATLPWQPLTAVRDTAGIKLLPPLLPLLCSPWARGGTGASLGIQQPEADALGMSLRARSTVQVRGLAPWIFPSYSSWWPWDSPQQVLLPTTHISMQRHLPFRGRCLTPRLGTAPFSASPGWALCHTHPLLQTSPTASSPPCWPQHAQATTVGTHGPQPQLTADATSLAQFTLVGQD